MEFQESDIEPGLMEENKVLSYHSLIRDIKEEEFLLHPRLIAEKQTRDTCLKRLMKNNKSKFNTKKVEGVEVVHYEDKIYIPHALQAQVLAWFHEYLVNPGETKMEMTLRQMLYWPGLRPMVQSYCKMCHKCQLSKKAQKKYGFLPAKQAETNSWDIVNVDLTGPYTVLVNGKEFYLRAITEHN